jgi:hypothetical protein
MNLTTMPIAPDFEPQVRKFYFCKINEKENKKSK